LSKSVEQREAEIILRLKKKHDISTTATITSHFFDDFYDIFPFLIPIAQQ